MAADLEILSSRLKHNKKMRVPSLSTPDYEDSPSRPTIIAPPYMAHSSEPPSSDHS